MRRTPILAVALAATSALALSACGGGGGNATAASIYVASMKEGHFSGLQVAPMEVKDLGEMDGSPHFLTRIEWDFGICLEHPSAIHRVTGVADAAIVA